MAAMSWILGGLGLASLAAAQFNSTVRITLDALDPIINFYTDRDPNAPATLDPWELDSKTEYITSGDRGAAMLDIPFVGTGYEMRGSVEWTPSSSDVREALQISLRWSNGTINNAFNITRSQGSTITSLSPLSLGTYVLKLSRPSGSTMTFHNFTIDVPVLSQAPSLDKLESQSTHTNAVRNGELDSRFTIENATWLGTSGENTAIPKRQADYEVRDNYVVLSDMMAVSYALPPNTTLVRVLGPTVVESEPFDQCTAILDPSPDWWQPSNQTYSYGYKAIREANRTLFLIPIDPAVQTTIKISPWITTTECYVVHRLTASNYTLADMLAREADAKNTGNSPAGDDSKSNNTGLIVGVVVGVLGGLAIFALLTWYFWRRTKRRKQELEEKNIPLVDSTAGSSAGGDVSENVEDTQPTPPTTSNRRTRGSRNAPPRHRIVQERDAGQAARFEPPPPSYGGGSVRGSPAEVRELTNPAAAVPSISTAEVLSHSDNLRTPQSALKAEYARAFGTPGSGSEDVSLATPTAPLKEEYARAFGSSRSGVTTPASAVGQPSLKGEYKRAFGSRTSSHGGASDNPSIPSSGSEARNLTPTSEQPLLETAEQEGGNSLQQDYKRMFKS